MTIEQAIANIPKGWLLNLVQTEADWSAGLVHPGIAWQISERGATAPEAIILASNRVQEGRLNPEFSPEDSPAYRRATR